MIYKQTACDAKGKTSQRAVAEASTAWRSMTEEARAPYVQRALQEKAAQLEALKTLGLRYRKTKYVAAVEAGLTAEPGATRGVQNFAHFQVPLQAEATAGSYGMVVPGYDPKSGERVAIKLFNGAKKDEARREVAAYQKLEGNGTASRKYFCTLLHDGQDAPLPFVALTWRGSSLQSLLPMEDDSKAVAAISQLRDALVALHHLGVLHTDVKPDNVLFRDLDHRVTLVDFQFAEIEVQPGIFDPSCSEYTSLPYRPPEMFSATKLLDVQQALRPPLDIWSYGVLVMRLLLKTSLFKGNSRREYQSSVQRWVASKTSREHNFAKAERSRPTLLQRLLTVHADFDKKLRSMLHPDPEQRHWP